MQPIKRPKLISDGFKESLYDGLYTLPDEILLEILKKLDIKMLCRMSQVNKRFNVLTRDSLLYTRLNIKNINTNHSYIRNVFCYFTPRCKFLQRLDLTFSEFYSSNFIKFLENCGEHLTHLRLNDCESINKLALVKISQICKNLKELDLRNSQLRSYNWDNDISCFENIENLERLRFKYRKIESSSFCKIFRKNPRIRELDMTRIYNKNIDNTHCLHGHENLDSVIIELKNSCPDLEIINLSVTCNISPEAINALAECKNLREVYLMNCRESRRMDINFIRCFSSCQRLEKLLLYCIFLTEHDLNFLIPCKNLKQLKLYHYNMIDNPCDKYGAIIKKNCPKMQKLSIVYMQCWDSYFYN